MKKTILMLAVLLSAIVGLSSFTAEELVGKWESNPIRQEPTPEMPMTVTQKYVVEYNADGTMSMKTNGSMSIELGKDPSTNTDVMVDIFLELSADGTYTCAGDSITLVCDVATAKVKFDEDDVRVRGMEDAAMATQVQNELYKQFGQMTEEMKEGLGEPQTFREVMITGKKMICKEDDIIITFKRKK